MAGGMIDEDLKQHAYALLTAWKLLLQSVTDGKDKSTAIDCFIDERDRIDREIEERLPPEHEIPFDEAPEFNLGALAKSAMLEMGVEAQLSADLPKSTALIEQLSEEIQQRRMQRAHLEVSTGEADANRLLDKLGIFPLKGGKTV